MTARTISITPDTFASFQVAAGQTIAVYGENLLITAVVNNTTYYTIDVKRGHNSTTPVTAAAGVAMFMTEAVGPDRLHPSDYGHLLISNMVYDTIKNASITGDSAGATGDYGWDHPGYPPENLFVSEPWIWPSGARANATLASLGGARYVEWLVPVDIFDHYHLTGLGVWFSTAPGSTKTFNLVVRKADNYGGGAVLQYVACSRTAALGEMSATFDLPLRPGRYMFGLQSLDVHSSLGAVRGYFPVVDIPLSLASATMIDPGQAAGYLIQHSTSDPTTTTAASDLVQNTASFGMPMIAMKGVAPPRD